MLNVCGFFLRFLIIPIDFLLRKLTGIREFSRDPGCILRVSIGKSDKDLVLRDGTRIQVGDPVGELHLWNERLPRMRSSGPDMAWGVSFHKQIVTSLCLLARYVECAPEFKSVRAYRGRIGIKEEKGRETVLKLAPRFGFEVIENPGGTCKKAGLKGFMDGVRWFFDNLYASGLMLVFNPSSLRQKKFSCFLRPEIWISARSLRGRYGPVGQPRLAENITWEGDSHESSFTRV